MKWPMEKLGIVAPAKPIKSPKIADSNSVWLLNLDMVESHTGRVIDKLFCSADEAGTSTHWFDENYVLYSKLRPYLNKVVVPDGLGLATTELVPMLPDPERLDKKYLAYYLRSEQFVRWVNEQVAGAKMPRVSMKIFWEHEIPLPPLEEQKRIVTILDKANAIRQNRQKAIALADDFLRSVFLDMFGDPVTNPKGWPVDKFSNLGTLDRGKSKHRPRNDPKLLGGKHPLIQTGDVAKSKGYIKEFESTYSDFGLEQSRKWVSGTLCITIAANIAKTGILTFDACFPDSVVGFTTNEKATVEFIQHWLGFLQKTLEDNAPESAQKNINLKILRDLDVPVPPIKMQKSFSDIVAKTLCFTEKENNSLHSIDMTFSSISQKAFSGQL